MKVINFFLAVWFCCSMGFLFGWGVFWGFAFLLFIFSAVAEVNEKYKSE